jgi:hypothetical protein
MALRKIQAFTNDGNTTTVYKDSEWGEYVVKVQQNGRPVPKVTYHTDAKDDAIGTAKAMIGLAGLRSRRRHIPGSKIAVTFHGRAGEKVTAEACRVDLATSTKSRWPVTQSKGWRKHHCAWAVHKNKKMARKNAMKALTKKLAARR